MVDKREDILARLVVVAGTVAGIKTVARNQLDVTDTKLPAIVILDADEAANDDDDPRRPANAPRLVTMAPELFIQNKGKSEAVGATLNAFRAAFVGAMFRDATLVALTGNSVGIRYEGCTTDLATGRTAVGKMGISMSFTYLLVPDQL